MVKVNRKIGNIEYDKNDIIIFIEEQIKMIPGVVGLRKNNAIKHIRDFLNLSSGKVQVYQINENEVYIELNLILSKDINYKQIESEIKKVLKYSIYKKFGLDVSNIDIYIQDLV